VVRVGLRQAPEPAKPPPFTNLNDMLKQAAELKSHQLKEKRRMWDAAPDWFKNTMVCLLHPASKGRTEEHVKPRRGACLRLVVGMEGWGGGSNRVVEKALLVF
jgi:hypothetical protein